MSEEHKIETITFKWFGSGVDIRIDLEPYKPTIFIGFNNTLKTITARMIIASLVDQGFCEEQYKKAL